MQGFFIIHKARRSHGVVKGSIIAGDHVEIRRHECAVCVDRGGRPAHQYGHTSGCLLVGRKSIGQWGKGSKIFGWQRHFRKLFTPETPIVIAGERTAARYGRRMSKWSANRDRPDLGCRPQPNRSSTAELTALISGSNTVPRSTGLNSTLIWAVPARTTSFAPSPEFLSVTLTPRRLCRLAAIRAKPS